MSTSPHDALFKAVFGQPEHAREQLARWAERVLSGATLAELLTD